MQLVFKNTEKGNSVTKCLKNIVPMFPKVAQKWPQQFLLESELFRNGPKSHHIFGLLLHENLYPTFFNLVTLKGAVAKLASFRH